MLLWKPPVYQGRDPVNGFYIDIKEADAPEEAWRGVNTKANEKTFIKVAIILTHFKMRPQLVCNVHFLSILQIKNLKEAETYVFRVRAQNKAGVGNTSDVTEPVPALTKPGRRKSEDSDEDSDEDNDEDNDHFLLVSGTTEIVVDVDDDGIISLNFECSDLTTDSKFVWSKNYEEITDSSRMTMETKGNKWDDIC